MNHCVLIKELRRLKETSKEAIEGIESFSKFKEYMHVSRKVEEELIEKLDFVMKNKKTKQLILVCGSVGDGKSHVISQIIHKNPEIRNHFKIHNDATESNNPTKSYKEILDELLNTFSDINIENNESYKLIVAINLGTLSNFIEDPIYSSKYSELKKYVDQNKIIEDVIATVYKNKVIDYVNFSDYSLYELTNDGATSSFMNEIFHKVVSKDAENKFYEVYSEHCIGSCVHKSACPVKLNYEFFENNNIRTEIIQLIIEAIIKYKIIVSVRSLLDFIYSVLVPVGFEELDDSNKLDKLEKTICNKEFFWQSLIPNILFENFERSHLFNGLYYLDPLNDRHEEIDQVVIELNTVDNMEEILTTSFKDGEYENLNQILEKLYFADRTKENLEIITKTYIRFSRILGSDLLSKRITYKEFVNELYHFNIHDNKAMENIYKTVIDAIYKWNGLASKNWINIDDNSISKDFSVSQELKIVPSFDIVSQEKSKPIIDKFEADIRIKLRDKSSDVNIEFTIDYDLYLLLSKVNAGYRLNNSDRENYIAFIDSLEKLLDQGEKNESIKIIHKSIKNDSVFHFKKNMFGGYVFERSY